MDSEIRTTEQHRARGRVDADLCHYGRSMLLGSLPDTVRFRRAANVPIVLSSALASRRQRKVRALACFLAAANIPDQTAPGRHYRSRRSWCGAGKAYDGRPIAGTPAGGLL